VQGYDAAAFGRGRFFRVRGALISGIVWVPLTTLISRWPPMAST
jgi:hypothetical protein